ncbi:hypothetical protein SDC9_195861 [bioreactor metagenome]|uniref:Uncharacterized protein n=1 Tax=bioreactor metagenome TaxID=1076179 RepID=A0A645IAG4_9ZZZZ
MAGFGVALEYRRRLGVAPDRAIDEDVLEFIGALGERVVKIAHHTAEEAVVNSVAGLDYTDRVGGADEFFLVLLG